MLDKDYQLTAYQELTAAGGLQTPQSETLSSSASTAAAALAGSLTGLVVSTVSYPDSVTEFVSGITAAASTLKAWAEQATTHATLISDNANLSTLLQLNIGWDVYCRANSQDVTELPISTAIADTATPEALVTAVGTLDISSLAAAMDDVNETLSSASSASTTTTTTATAVSLSEAQINALESAWEAFAALLSTATSAYSALQAVYTEASESVTTATTAYTNAVNTALAEASASNTSTASAVAALVPATVLASLENGSS